MNRDRSVRVVIVGGGSAGWMTAVALAKLLRSHCSVTLVESDVIGIVGVGEATLPHLRAFHERIGIDEAQFMNATQATFKLGIEFVDWARFGDRYMHPFERNRTPASGVDFHHYWNKARIETGDKTPFNAYSLAAKMSELNRFGHEDGSMPAGVGYAYQFDATRYAPFLRRIAETSGVSRVEGRVVAVERDNLTGDLCRISLDDGSRIEGDLFIDCSGFASLLLGGALGEPFEDWSHWLPCDRAIAIPSIERGPIGPFTTAKAMSSGWRWRIPLRERVGNGYVFSSAFQSDQSATDALLADIRGEVTASPRTLRFKAGRRRNSWVGNCLAIGLSSGFLEPLESTSIYLIQAAITALIENFPGRSIGEKERDEVNCILRTEYDRARDFIILHYHATERDDTPFWRHVRSISPPDSLAAAIELFRVRGRVEVGNRGLFLAPSWLAVLLGQRVWPSDFDPRIDEVDSQGIAVFLKSARGDIESAAAGMISHDQFLSNHRSRAWLS